MTDPTTTMTPPGDQVQQVKDQAAEQVQQVKEQASEQARNLADQARTQVDERSTQAGGKVTEHAGDLRSVAQHLRSEGKDQHAKLAEQAADKFERAGSWLTESDADKILREVEDFGRQRPWAVIGAGIAIGIAASRMLKASSSQRFETSRTSAPRALPPTTGATGLQGTTPYEAPVPATPTTPRTGEGTWSGPGNGTTY